jgi:hypothetical protein
MDVRFVFPDNTYYEVDLPAVPPDSDRVTLHGNTYDVFHATWDVENGKFVRVRVPIRLRQR